MDGEIAGYGRSIGQAQDDNERLVMHRKRLLAERNKFKRWAKTHTQPAARL